MSEKKERKEKKEKKKKLNPAKFEEYKIFIDDTARFTERRQNVSNLYVTVNSLLLTALMFAVKDLGTNEAWKLSFPALIVISGGFVSYVWHQLIKKYKALVGFRINKLREIELSEELSWTEKMYHAEDDLYPRDADGNMLKGEGLNFSDWEARLPFVFIALYFLAGIFIIATAFILTK